MYKNYLDVTKRAKYYQIGEANSSIKKVWMVFHGYAMLSEFFIKKFEVLNDGETLVIAPEALNRFYITENFSRVGASWMTKEDREDNVNVNPYDMSLSFMSPSKMLVESATMIFIIAFLLCSFTILVWRGSTMNSNQLLAGVFGLMLTFMLAVRQYASFR